MGYAGSEMLNRTLPLALLALAACSTPQGQGHWAWTTPPPPSYWERVPRKPASKDAEAKGEASRLLRETVPLYREVAEEWERGGSSKPEMHALLVKARRIERNLVEVQRIYTDCPGACEPEGRPQKVGELLTAIRTCIRQLEERL